MDAHGKGKCQYTESESERFHGSIYQWERFNGFVMRARDWESTGIFGASMIKDQKSMAQIRPGNAACRVFVAQRNELSGFNRREFGRALGGFRALGFSEFRRGFDALCPYFSANAACIAMIPIASIQTAPQSIDRSLQSISHCAIKDGFSKDSLLYLKASPSSVATLPPAARTIASAAAVSHSIVGPMRG